MQPIVRLWGIAPKVIIGRKTGATRLIGLDWSKKHRFRFSEPPGLIWGIPDEMVRPRTMTNSATAPAKLADETHRQERSPCAFNMLAGAGGQHGWPSLIRWIYASG